MTIALVKAGTAGAFTFGQATTAGNFLVALWASSDTGQGITGTGWHLDLTDTVSGFGECCIASRANCGASESAPSVTGGTNFQGTLLEFSGVATLSPLDRSVAAGNGVSTTNTVTATMPGTDAASGELVVMIAWCVNGGTTTMTFTDTFNNGTTHAIGQSNGSSSGNNAQAYYAYSITTGNSSADSWQSSDGGINCRYDVALASYKVAGATPYVPPQFRGSFVPQIRAAFH